MKRALLILALVLSGPHLAAAQANAPACGWYAFTDCKPSFDEAKAFAVSSGSGYVVNTSSPAYPNFQSGYFCVVTGPLDKTSATNTANYWRSIGVSPDAYIKSAC
jgi:hypothetical protein